MGAPTSSGRPRAEHLGPVRRRPQILDSALTLFLEGGYDGTSMAAVAEAAGVTKPVVYDSFAGKEELFKALVQREEARVLGEIQAALPQVADPDDPEATLVEGFTAFLRAVADSPQAYRVIFRGEGGANAALTRRIERGREQQVEAVAMLAKPWLQSGIDGDVDTAARLLGHLIVGLAEAGARAMLSEPRTWTPETLGRTLGRLAARGQAALWD